MNIKRLLELAGVTPLDEAKTSRLPTIDLVITVDCQLEKEPQMTVARFKSYMAEILSNRDFEEELNSVVHSFVVDKIGKEKVFSVGTTVKLNK